jgi:hypothetical protein
VKTVVLVFVLMANTLFAQETKKDENTRYILIEAPCKPGFKAKNDFKENVIFTKIFKKEFENAFELVNAEPELIIAFEVALEEAYPNSRNQIKDILVYMINSEKDAKALYKRKLKQFEALNTGIIELKIK